MSYSHRYDFITDEGCITKSMGGGDTLSLLSSSLVLDLEAKKALVDMSFSFGGKVSGTECAAYAQTFSRSVSGRISISYSQEIPVHEEPSIQLIATGSITEVSQQTTVQGIPSDLTANWQTQVTNPYFNCQQHFTGIPYKGEKTLNFPVNRATLTNGTYTYTPRYTSAVVGQGAGQRYRYIPASVTVNIPTTVTPSPAYLVLGQTTQLQINVPPCPKWTLTLTGPLAGGTDGKTCTYTTAGTTGNNAPKNINWNGNCTGGNMGVGTAQGKLIFEGSHIPPVNFTVPIMTTAPTPTPTPTPSATAPPPLPEDGTWAYLSDSRYCRKLALVHGIQQCIDCIGQEVELVNGEPVGCKPKHETAVEQRPFGVSDEGHTPYSQTWQLRICENPYNPSTGE